MHMIVPGFVELVKVPSFLDDALLQTFDCMDVELLECP